VYVNRFQNSLVPKYLSLSLASLSLVINNHSFPSHVLDCLEIGVILFVYEV
jgi:hypothetical protein